MIDFLLGFIILFVLGLLTMKSYVFRLIFMLVVSALGGATLGKMIGNFVIYIREKINSR